MEVSRIDRETSFMTEEDNNLREDVLENRLSFEFPSGMNKIDLLEEVRALANPDDLATIESVLLQKTEGKTISVFMTNYDGVKEKLCSFAVTSYDMDLSGVDLINEYPCIYYQMLKMFSETLKKKFPMPRLNSSEIVKKGLGKGSLKKKRE